jgi:ferredoxin
VALREGIELYGLKGRLGNCGGCGQCITCFVDVAGAPAGSLSPRTAVEDQKLLRRPQTWRLACQSLVESSLVVLTRPQSPPADGDALWAAAQASPLPVGPMAWPEPRAPEPEEEVAGEAAAGPTATSDEGADDLPRER